MFSGKKLQFAGTYLASFAPCVRSNRLCSHAGRRIFSRAYNYRTNVTLYPQWQEFLRSRQPKTLIFWGQDDIFFTREGGEAYLNDVPNAEMHRLDSGHFAVEDCLEYIARNIRHFYDEKVAAR